MFPIDRRPLDIEHRTLIVENFFWKMLSRFLFPFSAFRTFSLQVFPTQTRFATG
jgi:hypothetical protein